MNTIVLREAVKEDIPQLLPLLEQLFAIERDFIFDEQLQARGLSLLIGVSTAIVAVAEAQGKVVGMATGQIVISTAEGGPALLVEDVSVEQAYRNRGIGSALLEAVENMGTKRGAHRMQLLADKHNEAGLSFYTKLGWDKTALICLRKNTGG